MSALRTLRADWSDERDAERAEEVLLPALPGLSIERRPPRMALPYLDEEDADGDLCCEEPDEQYYYGSCDGETYCTYWED